MSWVESYRYAGDEYQTRAVGMAFLYYCILTWDYVVRVPWNYLQQRRMVREIRKSRRPIR
jgi:hypothetical protein